MSRLDQQGAMRILKSNVVVSVGVTASVRVSNVTTRNGKTGRPFLWEDTKEPYAIANFQAMNNYGASKALEQFKAGSFDDCVNNNLSARVTMEQAEQLQKSLYATIEVAPAELKDGSFADLIRKVIPNEPIVAKNFSFGKENVNEETSTPATADEKF